MMVRRSGRFDHRCRRPRVVAVDVTPLTPVIGAEITGLDWAVPVSDDVLAGIRKALLDHQVVVVHGAAMSPEQHVALGERLGEVEVHTFFPNLGPGRERVSVLDSDVGTQASMWHSDETFLERPPMGTLLHAQMLPAWGGDTCFASMTAAYDGLSSPMKRYLDGMTAEHGLSHITELKQRRGFATEAEVGDAIAHDRRSSHPVVRRHPETGAPSLFVNPTYTRWLDGVAEDESEAVLRLLFAHATQEKFVYRHRWTAADLVIWDNRCTMHLALGGFDGRRRMHRVSVLDECRPEAV
jgi:alpha-ketoglutarate-dependent taurine dioxygenase